MKSTTVPHCRDHSQTFCPHTGSSSPAPEPPGGPHGKSQYPFILPFGRFPINPILNPPWI